MVSIHTIALSIFISVTITLVTGYEADWKELSGAWIQVSFDGHQVCGVNLSNDILCATNNLKSTPTWRQISPPNALGKGDFKWVAIWGPHLWAVNTYDEVWYGQSSGDPQWVQLPGFMKQISTDGTQICGCNSNNEVYCADQGITSNPVWRPLPGNLKQLDITNGVIYGVSSNNSVWFGMANGATRFIPISGSLQQIAFDGQFLCGIDSVNNVLCADSGLTTSPNWHTIGNSFTQVAVQAGRVYGVNTANSVWLYSTTPWMILDEWYVVQGKLLTGVNTDGQTVCGMDSNQDVYCTNKDGSTPWKPLLGTKFVRIMVRGAYLWGEDKDNNTWYGQLSGEPRWRQLPAEF